MPGVTPPDGDGGPATATETTDEGSSGAPPDPLDRLWFHPSELGAVASSELPVSTPEPGHRSWVLITVAALTGAITAIAVVAAAGHLHRADPSSALVPPGGGPSSVTSSEVTNALLSQRQRNGRGPRGRHQPGVVTIDASGMRSSDRDVLTSLVALGRRHATTTARAGCLSASITGVDGHGPRIGANPGRCAHSGAKIGSSDGLNVRPHRRGSGQR